MEFEAENRLKGEHVLFEVGFGFCVRLSEILKDICFSTYSVCRSGVESCLGGHAHAFLAGSSCELVSNWSRLCDWQFGVCLVYRPVDGVLINGA